MIFGCFFRIFLSLSAGFCIFKRSRLDFFWSLSYNNIDRILFWRSAARQFDYDKG